MLGEFQETATDIGMEIEQDSPGLRWSRRARALGALAFSGVILVLGALAIALLGIPIALITGLVEGDWQAAEAALAEIWRLSPLLLAAEFVLAWLLVALLLILRRILANFDIEVP